MGRRDDETIREAESSVEPARFAPRPARLHVMGRGNFQSLELPQQGRWVIGRGQESDVQLDDHAVSRKHALLHLGDPVRIEDTGSANGTRLRGKLLTKGELADVRPGDPIEISGWTLTVSVDGPSERGRKIWPHGYFEACLQAETAHAEKEGLRLDVVRVRAAKPLDPSAAARALGADLRADELVAELAPGDYEMLLIGRDRELAETIIRAATQRLRDLGVQAAVGSAEFPREGRSPGELLARAADAARGVGPGARSERIVVVEEPSMQRLHRLIERVAGGSISVLILGETGVGKEVSAEMIHKKSQRASGPFVRLNCAALSESLIESELFGHEKGAFTGALRAKPGLMETAEGGTLFLDEVGELPMSLQVKLLRVLEERQVLRVGGLKPTPIDVRLVSATNRDLEKEIGTGKFRQDLYFRLNGITLTVPPLRERVSEIKSLAKSFISLVCAQDRRQKVPELTPQALKILENYSWPGNIRELKNVIERAVLLAEDEPISPQHLPLEKMQLSAPAPAPDGDDRGTASQSSAEGERLVDQMQAFERDRIIKALDACNGNQTQAAKMLGIARRTLINRLEQYKIERPRKRVSDDED